LNFGIHNYRLKEAGAEVTVVGSGSAMEYQSKMRLPARVDAHADQVLARDFDGIVIPGGYAPDMMRRYPAMIKLVKDFCDAGKVVAAICHAGWMLASENILAGRNVHLFLPLKMI